MVWGPQPTDRLQMRGGYKALPDAAGAQSLFTIRMYHSFDGKFQQATIMRASRAGLLLSMAVAAVLPGSMSAQELSCRLERDGFDFGPDYFRWSHVNSQGRCAVDCLAEGRCAGFTWVDGGGRNCALYDESGVRRGVTQRGQDSYLCYPRLRNEYDNRIFQLNEDGKVECQRDDDCPSIFEIIEDNEEGYTQSSTGYCEDRACWVYEARICNNPNPYECVQQHASYSKLLTTISGQGGLSFARLRNLSSRNKDNCPIGQCRPRNSRRRRQ